MTTPNVFQESAEWPLLRKVQGCCWFTPIFATLIVGCSSHGNKPIDHTRAFVVKLTGQDPAPWAILRSGTVVATGKESSACLSVASAVEYSRDQPYAASDCHHMEKNHVLQVDRIYEIEKDHYVVQFRNANGLPLFVGAGYLHPLIPIGAKVQVVESVTPPDAPDDFDPNTYLFDKEHAHRLLLDDLTQLVTLQGPAAIADARFPHDVKVKVTSGAHKGLVGYVHRWDLQASGAEGGDFFFASVEGAVTQPLPR